jgi:hypothetical protein
VRSVRVTHVRLSFVRTDLIGVVAGKFFSVLDGYWLAFLGRFTIVLCMLYYKPLCFCFGFLVALGDICSWKYSTNTISKGNRYISIIPGVR